MKNKIKPILFSTPMVEAILNGKKTQTRRVIKPTSKKGSYGILVVKNVKGKVTNVAAYDNNERTFNDKPGKEYPVNGKYKIGDILWVRESFTYGSDSYPYVFKANYENQFPSDIENIPEPSTLKWKPSIFMPKETCRLFLKIKDVRVERLKDISEEDAIAEGANHGRYLGIGKIGGSVREGYFELWERINGKSTVLDNPLVWVIEFERVEKPDNFFIN